MLPSFFSLKNLSLSNVGEGAEVGVLWALVFLTMMLRIKRIYTTEIERKKENRKTKGRLQVSIEKKNKQFYMMHEHYQYMMHALM